MPQQHRSRSRAACVEECDDDGNVIPNTERYATSQPPSPRPEKSNIGKSRKGDKRGRSPRRHIELDDDSEEEERVSPTSYRMKSGEKEKGPAAYKKAHVRPPPPKHTRTMPVVVNPRADESEYYGVRAGPGGPPPPHPDERRPRAFTAAARPPSFHDHPRPPPANAAYFNQQRYPPPHGHSGPIPTSFPPPTWHQNPMGGPPPGYPPPLDHAPPPPALPAPPPRTSMAPRGEHPSQFPPPSHRGPPRGRPMSAMGHHRPSPSFDFEEAFDVDSGPPPGVPHPPMNRRVSNARRGDRANLDRLTMPPPQRPQSARPNQLVYRPPMDLPSARSRESRKSMNFSAVDYDSESVFADPNAYEHISPAEARRDFGIQIPRESPMRESPYSQMSYPHRPAPHGRRPSVSTVDRSISYDQGNYHTEVSRPAARRHSTVYGYGPVTGGASLATGSDYESDDDDGMNAQILKMKAHTGDTRRRDSRLTESALHKAVHHPAIHSQRRSGGSSRSTRSSESWDTESDEYRESATTRTTHSGHDEQESVTIKIKNAKTARVGGVDIEINGGEIEIQRGPGASETRSLRGDTSTVYNEGRSRYPPERPALPPAPRRTDSFSSRGPARAMTVGPGMPGLPMPPTPQSRAPVPYGYNFDDPYAMGIASGALPPPSHYGGY